MAVLDQHTSNRKLAAILSADIAGYSALMGADEEGTVGKLRQVREAVLPIIERFGGRVIDLAGDGILAEFPSAVRAVESAAAVQSRTAELNTKSDPPMLFRIGVNVGDVIHEGERLYGDGINVAARLQAMAKPGGICISNKVHEEVRDRVKLAFTDIGEQELKNIARPVRVFSWTSTKTPPKAPNTLALPEKPSIAVLPFQNISGDPEQEYFADGVVEDIITSLSQVRWLFVIARNSSFTYKGRSVDVRQVGRELGVRYVLEGSVRRAGSRLRITGQLIEAETGRHLWADRFDAALEDVFDVQDEVTTNVVGAIAPRVEQAEIARSKLKPTDSLVAYDYYLRGVDNVHQQTNQSTSDAIALFRSATVLDPAYSLAYAMGGFCYSQRKAFGWVTARGQDIKEAEPLARRAVELCNDDALVCARSGLVLAYVVEDFEAGTQFINRARALNSNLSAVWHASGWLRVWLGSHDEAIADLQRFVRLSPLDPLLHSVRSAISFAHVFAGRYMEGISSAEEALGENPKSHQALRAAALSYSFGGRHERARRAISRLLEIDPTFTISKLTEFTPLRREVDIARYRQGMRMAGLPE